MMNEKFSKALTEVWDWKDKTSKELISKKNPISYIKNKAKGLAKELKLKRYSKDDDIVSGSFYSVKELIDNLKK